MQAWWCSRHPDSAVCETLRRRQVSRGEMTHRRVHGFAGGGGEADGGKGGGAPASSRDKLTRMEQEAMHAGWCGMHAGHEDTSPCVAWKLAKGDSGGTPEALAHAGLDRHFHLGAKLKGAPATSDS